MMFALVFIKPHGAVVKLSGFLPDPTVLFFFISLALQVITVLPVIQMLT